MYRLHRELRYSSTVFRLHLLIIVYDGVEAVGYSEDGTVSKLCADGLLNEIISLQIYCCCGLIQNQNLGLAQQSSCQTHQLTLANTRGYVYYL